MNAYYHKFSIGFNWWELFAVLCIVLMVVLGIKQMRLTQGLKIRRRVNSTRFFSIVAGFDAAIFAILLFVESRLGIVQWFDNSLAPGDSAVWSLILAPFAIVAAALAFFALLYGVAKVTCWAREGYLCERRREIVESQKTEAKNDKGSAKVLNFG